MCIRDRSTWGGRRKLTLSKVCGMLGGQPELFQRSKTNAERCLTQLIERFYSYVHASYLCFHLAMLSFALLSLSGGTVSNQRKYYLPVMLYSGGSLIVFISLVIVRWKLKSLYVCLFQLGLATSAVGSLYVVPEISSPSDGELGPQYAFLVGGAQVLFFMLNQTVLHSLILRGVLFAGYIMYLIFRLDVTNEIKSFTIMLGLLVLGILFFRWRSQIVESLLDGLATKNEELSENMVLLHEFCEALFVVGRQGNILFRNQSTEIMFGPISPNATISELEYTIGTGAMITLRRRKEIRPTLHERAKNLYEEASVSIDEEIGLRDVKSSVIENFSWKDLIAAELSNVTREIETKESDHVFDIRWKNSRGEVEKALELKTKRMQYRGEESVLLLFRDVSELHERQREKDLNDYKRNMLASVSHELKTPINCALGLLEELEKQPTLAKELCDAFVTPSLMSLRLLEYFARDIIDMSAILQKEINLKFRFFNLQKVLSDVCSLFENIAATRGQQIILEIDEELPRDIFGEPERLSQILVNLLNNAFKFSFGGDVRVMAKIIETEETSNLCVFVADNGIGMDLVEVESLRAILKAPNGAHTVGLVRRSKGVCFGLSLSQSLALAIGSTGLSIQSAKGEGSVFSLKLPLRGREKPLEEDRPRTEQVRLSESTKFLLEERCDHPAILVVDDNQYNVHVLSTKLRGRGFEVFAAFNGIEVLDCIEARKLTHQCSVKNCAGVAIAFMDVDMPVMNGLETTRELVRRMRASELASFPIVGCSAFDSSSAIAEGFAVGMRDYIGKPVTDKKIDSVLKKFRYFS
eukprot:TRINITY_DN17639_c0_g1_i2.p1 TRINITY_DN17639_c0_g1~~TRINITY_DN17639_c0_g1_i2.p1  ORF type:complete len:829 (+),score=183.28 TRINITY_DN17639_c0_g1_i2:60-2489(+)